MPRNEQSPRTWHLCDANALRIKLWEDTKAIDRAKLVKADQVKGDNARFFKDVCRLEPYWYQLELANLYQSNQFVAVRWPRQTGKSTSIGALLLQDAWENNDLSIGLIGPSWRQTKLNIRRIASFCRYLPSQDVAVQKTRITIKRNGSVLEAFPNNPETVRGNTFNRVWGDEWNFIANAEELYDSILFTLGTTNGKLIASSTPFNSDSLFWKMCNHKDYSDFARHHFGWEKALTPIGPLKPTIIEKIKRQFGDDPARWRREMEAEWAEDEDVWLPQSLIVSSVGTVKNCGQDLQEFNSEASIAGEFFGGLDLAQTRDYCVFSIVERVNDVLLLRHLKIFSQPTKYAHVLGYIKAVQDRWAALRKSA